jgi:ABC-type microcin C transport system duplicated ATPase subunit YejF
LVFIVHNLAVVEQVAHDVQQIDFGRVMDSGAKARMLVPPLQPCIQAPMSATPARCAAACRCNEEPLLREHRRAPGSLSSRVGPA